MKRINIIRTGLICFLAAIVTSCYPVHLQDLTADGNYDGNKTSTFRIFKVLQIDDVNVNGIDILPYFDFFDTFSLTLTYEEGKISHLTMSNGDIPFSKKYGFDIPSGEVDVYFDGSVFPNAIRRSDNNEILATFNKGVLVMDFQLDCASVSYRYMFTGVNE